MTAASVGDWYQGLAKPPFTPPDWLFGPVWSVLYLMMAISAWRIWRREDSNRRPALLVYFFQLAINLLWSALFFAAREIGWALLDILVLLALIAVTMSMFLRVDRWAGLALAPYLLWVAYAAVLNGAIWHLN